MMPYMPTYKPCAATGQTQVKKCLRGSPDRIHVCINICEVINKYIEDPQICETAICFRCKYQSRCKSCLLK